MSKVIKLSDDVVKQLDKLRHMGQSYDGVLREILEKKAHKADNEQNTRPGS